MKHLSRALVFLASANIILLALVSTYDLQIGSLHLVAHGLFKPLLYLSAAVILCILLASKDSKPLPAAVSIREPLQAAVMREPLQAAVMREPLQAAVMREPLQAAVMWSPPAWSIVVAIVALYLPTLAFDFDNNDWKHYYTSATITSLNSALHLFTSKQPDGFYRPLAFVSLWIDHSIFQTHGWGYHLQNIALHVVNALLVGRLGRALGLDAATANFSALLFGVAAVNYEPVLWPGARFDLLAAMFVLLALLAFLNYVRQPEMLHKSLVWTLVFFAAGLLSKESAYCVPVLVVFLLLTHETWRLPSIPLRRGILSVASVGAVAAIFIGIRYAIYGSLGGYPDASGVAPHFELKLVTLTSFFTRALPVPLFAPNSSVTLPWWTRAAVVGFGVWACVYGVLCGGTLRRNAGLLAASLLTALPAANLVDWIGPMMHNTRYLYLPSLWIFLLVAAGASQSLWARRSLIALVLINAVGVAHNLANFEWIDPGVRPVAFNQNAVIRSGNPLETPPSVR